MERFLHALLGAFMGSIIGLGALLVFAGDINWLFVSFAAITCAIMAFVWGESFLEWLKEAFDFWS